MQKIVAAKKITGMHQSGNSSAKNAIKNNIKKRNCNAEFAHLL